MRRKIKPLIVVLCFVCLSTSVSAVTYSGRQIYNSDVYTVNLSSNTSTSLRKNYKATYTFGTNRSGGTEDRDYYPFAVINYKFPASATRTVQLPTGSTTYPSINLEATLSASVGSTSKPSGNITELGHRSSYPPFRNMLYEIADTIKVPISRTSTKTITNGGDILFNNSSISSYSFNGCSFNFRGVTCFSNCRLPSWNSSTVCYQWLLPYHDYEPVTDFETIAGGLYEVVCPFSGYFRYADYTICKADLRYLSPNTTYVGSERVYITHGASGPDSLSTLTLTPVMENTACSVG